MLRVGLAIITHHRPVELAAALASVEDQGFDEVVVLDMASDPPATPAPGVVWLREDLNAGYIAGRNRIVAQSSADVVVFIDDDAVLESSGSAARVRALFTADPRLGAAAFAIRRPDGSVHSSEHPFRGRPRHVDVPRPCAYVVGAAHAVRCTAWKEIGGLDERYFYSTEEVDLGLRLSHRGWDLYYEPAVAVEHRPSPRGRSAAGRVSELALRNRILLARRHLPWPVAAVHIAIWAARTVPAAGRSLGGGRAWLRAWRDGFRLPVERQPLGYRRLVHVHRLGGRALF